MEIQAYTIDTPILIVAGITDYTLFRTPEDDMIRLTHIAAQNFDSAASFITLRVRWYNSLLHITTLSLALVDTVYSLQTNLLLPLNSTIEAVFSGGAAGDNVSIYLFGEYCNYV